MVSELRCTSILMVFLWHREQLKSHIRLCKVAISEIYPIMAALCVLPHSLCYLPDPVSLSWPTAVCTLAIISITAILLLHLRDL